jgi:mannose-6-phosphate isomerase-like protein (cupin superfamily)
MTPFTEIHPQGLDRCWLETSLDPAPLHLHITELPPGSRPHPPHSHGGIEAFYLLEGNGAIETEDGRIPLEANQAVILDSNRKHGVVNTGSVPMKYLVIQTS